MIPPHWSASDRIDAARERVAIMVHDGGVPLDEAVRTVAALYGVSVASLRA